MTDESNRNEMREQLRAYLIDTLEPEERAAVEDRLAVSEAWREALDEERAALEQLDLLKAVEPSRDLTDAVLDEVQRIEAARKTRKRRWVPTFAELAVLLCIIGGLAAILLPALGRAREASRRASDQNNMKQLGLVFKMYANESDGETYPPLAPYDGIWMFDIQALYPEYLTDLSVLVNPSLPDADDVLDEMNRLIAEDPIDWERIHRLAAKSYTYTGWALSDPDDLAVLSGPVVASARRDGQGDVQNVPRLREGVERFFITDINNPAGSASAQSEIPVLFNNPTVLQHLPDGGNVLYMDGHVEFHEHGTAFPLVEEMKAFLQGE